MHTGVLKIPICIQGLHGTNPRTHTGIAINPHMHMGSDLDPRTHTVIAERSLPVCVLLPLYAYGDHNMQTGITVCIWLEIKYNWNTTLSPGYHFTTQ
jgi:hypothetical protein